MTNWYEIQKRRDSENRARSEAYLGPEKQFFEEFMGLSARCFDAIFDSARRDEIQSRRVIEFGHHAFNLLCAAWDQMLCGRYAVAQAQSRSISESCEFLTAITAQPAIAEDLGSGTSAKRKARKGIRDVLGGRRGVSFFNALKQAEEALHPYAHVTHKSAGLLPVRRSGGVKTAVVRPGGELSEETSRSVAIQLAIDAMNLHVLLAAASMDILDFPQEDWYRIAKSAEQRIELLGRELRSMKQGPPACRLEFLSAYESNLQSPTSNLPADHLPRGGNS